MGRPRKFNNNAMPQLITRAMFLISRIATEHQVTLAEIEGPSRVWRIAWPRHLAIAAVRHHTGLTFKILGYLFKRDQHSVWNACSQVENLTQTDRKLRAEWERIVSLTP
jgi:chromosomal replication initiation ATPase DnaA